MEVIVLKYVQLVCITIFMRNNNANCAQLMGRSEEMNNLKVAACAADCLKANWNYVSRFRMFLSRLLISSIPTRTSRSAIKSALVEI